MIEQHVAWNDDIGEWQLRCVAYTGNNMRKQTPQPDKDKEKVSTHSFILSIKYASKYGFLDWYICH